MTIFEHKETAKPKRQQWTQTAHTEMKEEKNINTPLTTPTRKWLATKMNREKKERKNVKEKEMFKH